MMMAVGALVVLVVGVLAGLAGLAALAGWLWVLVDCLRHETDEHQQRLVWALVIVLGNVLGALIYLLVRRPQRQRERQAAGFAG